MCLTCGEGVSDLCLTQDGDGYSSTQNCDAEESWRQQHSGFAWGKFREKRPSLGWDSKFHFGGYD